MSISKLYSPVRTVTVRENNGGCPTPWGRKDSMSSALFFAVAAVAAAILYAVHRDTGKVQKAILHAAGKTHLHQMLGIVIVVAHASQIGEVITHLTVVHMAAALLLFAVWMATRKTNADELA